MSEQQTSNRAARLRSRWCAARSDVRPIRRPTRQSLGASEAAPDGRTAGHAVDSRHDRRRFSHLVTVEETRRPVTRSCDAEGNEKTMPLNLTTSTRTRERTQRTKRVGRGTGSGHGKTSGRGTKGQKARSGRASAAASKAASCRFRSGCRTSAASPTS